MPSQIDWPNPQIDIVVLSWRGLSKRQFTIRPRRRGLWRLLVWPTLNMAFDSPFQVDLRFASEDDLAQTVNWEPRSAQRNLRQWSWNIAPIEEEGVDKFMLNQPDFRGELPISLDSPTSDQMLGNRGISGTFELFELNQKTHSVVVWSCHQPYEGGEGETPRVIDGTNKILDWYARRLEELKPDIAYGLGDTAYSDGCAATNFVDYYYSQDSRLDDPKELQALAREYQRMYRHYWSFDGFRRVQQSVPQIYIWDDHELRDGSGSEAEDRDGANPVIRDVATQVANAYILDQGPRVRPRKPGHAPDAHKAYRYGSIASFIFDGRSGREYHGTDGKVISDVQMADFKIFCEMVAQDSSVKFLLLGTAVPFINTKDFVEELGSKAPKLVTDLFAGIRDDVRDSWHSPGNRAQLDELLGIVRRTFRKNDDCVLLNVSGDVHISNAFSFIPPGFTRACYQITTSAITNRQHLPAPLGVLFETGTWDFSSSLGIISRIWINERNPNFLQIKERDGLLDLHLNVLDETGETEPGALDQTYSLGTERFGLRRARIG